MKKARSLAALVAIALVPLGLVRSHTADAAVTNLTVGPNAISLFPTPTTDWVSNDEVSNGPGDVTFVTGPATAPLGTGSTRIKVATGTSHSALVYLNMANAATLFSQISSLQYSTYRSSADAGNNLAATLQFNVDYDKTDANTNWQGRVVFEPYFTIGSGNVVQNTWQTWNPMSGKWWMTGNPVVGNVTGTKACPQASPCTWAALLSTYGNAGFNGGQPFVTIKGGSGPGWAGFDGNVDAFTLGVGGNDTVVDFEPACTTDCYVATTGSDTATGTVTDPFLTVQKGVDAVTAGGTVHVANGTYAAGATINKAITLDGASKAGTIIDGPSSGTGLAVGAVNNVSITDLTVKHFNYGITTFSGPIANFLVQNVAATDNVTHGIWSQAFGVTNYTLDGVDASRNNQVGGLSGRGFWMINGVKQNVTVTNSTFDQNGLVGLDISDGSVTGLSITANTVTNNGDSGIGVLGAIGGSANLVDGNTVTNNGRYGIEIKNSTGDGTDTGTGSLTVSNNTVSRTVAATDARDYGGIVVIRRSPVAPAPTQPAGVTIENNTVSGFHRKPAGSTGDGFGIVVGGLNHVITKNTVSNNDVGIQVQAGNTANVQSTVFFDRDDAAAGNASATRNAITGNGLGMRLAGTATVTATCNWWGDASGPGAPGGAGSGDGVATGITTSPWLLTSDLDGTCGGAVTVDVGSVSAPEGSGTDTVINVPVTLSAPFGGPVTVDYATADGSGLTGAVAPNDYTSASGTLVIPGGQTNATIPVTFKGSGSPQYDEFDETFTITLSNPTNATLGTDTGTLTIQNDDSPTVSVSATPLDTVEGNSGTHTATVTVNLSNPSVAPITVAWATSDGSAISATPKDYNAASGTVTFAPGQMAKTFTVTIVGDTRLEDYEFFNAVISSPTGGGSGGAILGNATRQIQIQNDEKPALTAGSANGPEGSTLVFGATLQQRYYLPITIAYATTNGTATAPIDFTAVSGNLVFAAGTKGTQTVGVTTKYDFTTETAEKFSFTWSSASLKVSPIVKTGTIKGNKS